MASNNPGGGVGSVGTPIDNNPGGGAGSVGDPITKTKPVVKPITDTEAAAAVAAEAANTATTGGKTTAPVPSNTTQSHAPNWPRGPWTFKPPKAKPTLTDAQQSADAYVKQYLTAWGLNDDALVNQLWHNAKMGQGRDQLLADLRGSQAYKVRFSGMAALAAKGEAISEHDYMGVEASLASQMQGYGMSQYATHDFLGKVIGASVSPSEFATRLQDVQDIVNNVPAKDYFRSEFGISTGDLMAYWLNPAEAEPVIHQKVQAAKIGAAAGSAGVGILDPATALHLAGLGITQDQAVSGFGKIGQNSELEQDLGHGTSAVSLQDMIGATFQNNAEDQKKMDMASGSRVAAFQNGGSFAGTTRGESGLEDANALNL